MYGVHDVRTAFWRRRSSACRWRSSLCATGRRCGPRARTTCSRVVRRSESSVSSARSQCGPQIGCGILQPVNFGANAADARLGAEFGAQSFHLLLNCRKLTSHALLHVEERLAHLLRELWAAGASALEAALSSESDAAASA